MNPMKSCSTLIFRPPCFLPPQHDAKRTSNLRTEGLVQRRPQPVSPKEKCMPPRLAAVLSFLSRFSPPSPSGGARRKVDALQKKLSFLPSSLKVSFLRSHTSMISTKFLQNFRDFGPVPLVCNFAKIIVLNPPNFPYYVCIWVPPSPCTRRHF